MYCTLIKVVTRSMMSDFEHFVELLERAANVGVPIFLCLVILGVLLAVLWYGKNHIEAKDQATSDIVRQMTTEFSTTMRENVSTLKEVNQSLVVMQAEVRANNNKVDRVIEMLSAHDERSHSVKEICCDTNDTLEETRREQATKDDIATIQSTINQVNLGVNTLVAKTAG